MNNYYPPKLKAGDKVGLICPGSPISDDQYQTALSNMKQLGLQVVEGKYIKAKYGYLAGSDTVRLRDFNAMWGDDSIKAIWCIRGGYGCARLLPDIDLDLIRRKPKVLVGYSDVTVLLNYITQETGLITYHGPIAGAYFPEEVFENIQQTLFEKSSSVALGMAKLSSRESEAGFLEEVINEGESEGVIMGGNLALITSLIGTPYQVHLKGKLLFLEDIHEKPYCLDRLLTTLIQSGGLDGVIGIALGIFVDCQAAQDAHTLSLVEMFRDRLSAYNIPIQYGYSFGHIDYNMMIPVGGMAQLNTFESLLNLTV